MQKGKEGELDLTQNSAVIAVCFCPADDLAGYLFYN